MKKLKSVVLLAMVLPMVFVGCKEDEEEPVTNNKTLTLDISGLEDLGADYAYEGWIIVDGAAKTAGIFTVNGSGDLSSKSFSLNADDLDKASAYVLTIEPSPDNDPGPSSVHILAGDFSGSSASLSVSHGSAIGTDFSQSTGKYILATPTDGGNMTDEKSGVWWLDPMAGPGPGLDLPALPSGWEYEGWAVIDGTPLSTGKFTTASGSDDAAPFSGSAAGPPFPGEDFLMNAPMGLSFPTDLSGKTVVISVEPKPDNSTAPFVLKPLVGNVPATTMDHTVYTMDNNASATNPTGTASR